MSFGFKDILPMIAGTVGGIYGGPIGAGLASGATSGLTHKDMMSGLRDGLLAYAGSSLLQGLSGAGETANSADMMANIGEGLGTGASQGTAPIMSEQAADSLMPQAVHTENLLDAGHSIDVGGGLEPSWSTASAPAARGYTGTTPPSYWDNLQRGASSGANWSAALDKPTVISGLGGAALYGMTADQQNLPPIDQPKPASFPYTPNAPLNRQFTYPNDPHNPAFSGNYGHFKRGGPVRAYAGGGAVKGPGGGLDDAIQVGLDGGGVAQLSDSEFVIPADVVSAIGDGSTKNGSEKLYELMKQIREKKYGRNKQPPSLNTGLQQLLNSIK